jgi:thiosulfate dehydrogenase
MNERQSRRERGGMTAIVLACCAVGAMTIGATLTLGPHSATPSRPNVPAIATEEYGKRLLAQTPELLGPDSANPTMHFSGSRLSCGSCHLGTGTEPGTLNLLQATQHYPRFSARVGGMTDIEDRVNECLQRSMNGKPLPANSPEMIAMSSYIRSLGDRNAAMGASLLKVKEPPPFKTPDRAADLTAGKQVFGDRCALCHGADGAGLLAAADRIHGYVFPPLWGPDSFNDGAGMHRVLTAARFIKARMPLGKADLTDDQAFDTAAFINSQPRPHMPNLDRDFPDRSAKPVDTGYGPYADSFPPEQHQFGPFAPIEAYYKKLKKSRSK